STSGLRRRERVEPWFDGRHALLLRLMRAELRSSPSRPGQLEIENGLRLLLGVHHELETVLQERAHHQTHLILGWLTVRPRFNVESLVVNPSREVLQVTRSQPVCK